MKKRHKIFLKINLTSLFFIVISFVSVSLAWFGYAGLTEVKTEIDIKSWYIRLNKVGEDDKPYETNNITITLPEIYPGMEPVIERIKIKNLGDSDTNIYYSISKVRILDNIENEYEVGEKITKEELEDILSHHYPFHINMNLTKRYAVKEKGESIFEVSASWPLDSGDDIEDTAWGREAYDFKNNEILNNTDRPAVQLVISVIAEQYVPGDDASNPLYNLGDKILYNVKENKICQNISEDCIETTILNVNSKLGDETITLLPNLNNNNLVTFDNSNDELNQVITNWSSDTKNKTRLITISDILKIISTDITSSNIIRSDISSRILGTLSYNNRMKNEVEELIEYNGYFSYKSSNFDYFTSNDCYWINNDFNINNEYDSNNAFSYSKIDDNMSKLYGNLKSNTCKVLPVIVLNKIDL